jgi:hypothetical protein
LRAPDILSQLHAQQYPLDQPQSHSYRERSTQFVTFHKQSSHTQGTDETSHVFAYNIE